jgi:hypothetical protein
MAAPTNAENGEKKAPPSKGTEVFYVDAVLFDMVSLAFASERRA